MLSVSKQARDTSTASVASDSESCSRLALTSASPSLLGIPLELRHQVLQELFADITIHMTWRTTKQDTEWQRKLAVLSTCQLLRAEGTAVLQANLTLIVTEEPARGSKHVPAYISLSTLPKAITNNVHTSISHTEPLAHPQCYLDLFPVVKRIELWTNLALRHLDGLSSEHFINYKAHTDTNTRSVIANELLWFRGPGDVALYEQFELWTLGYWGCNQEGCAWWTTKLRRHQYRELLRPLRRTPRRPCWRPPQQRECEFRVIFEIDMTGKTRNADGRVHFAVMIDPIRQRVANRYFLFRHWNKRAVRDTWIPGREVLLVEEPLQYVWENIWARSPTWPNAAHGLPKHVLWAPGHGLVHGLGQLNPRVPEELYRMFEDAELAEIFLKVGVRCD